MTFLDVMTEMGHEQLVLCRDESRGYRGVIAIHSTALGVAVGGTRFWSYASEEEAIVDALRLSRGMTYKNALAGLAWGGGKSVIIGDSRTADRQSIFRAHGRFVEGLGGRYVAAEDVGTSTADMEIVFQETKHVAGLAHRTGDPSPVTTRGVFRAMQAAARWRWGSDELAGRTVALQGAGNVGRELGRQLVQSGARVIVSDVDEGRARALAADAGARVASADGIYDVGCDIFAPCALGGILNDATIPRLRAEVVCGAANNQLLEERHGAALEARGILYAPDYAANAGGVLSGYRDHAGWTVEQTSARVEGIYDTLLAIFDLARSERIPTSQAADRLAEEKLRGGARSEGRGASSTGVT